MNLVILSYIHSSYTQLEDSCNKLNIKQVDGMLLVLGLSSYQLEDNQRGFFASI